MKISMVNLSLQQEYFNAIRLGLKTVEGRLNSPKFNDLKVGMNINFTCMITHELIVCSVQAINIYANFKDMLTTEGLKNMLPKITSINEGVTLYESFPGYREGVKKLGALAIKIKKV